MVPKQSSDDTTGYQTVKLCNERHGTSKKVMWTIVGFLGFFLGAIGFCIERAWSASSKADTTATKVESIENTIREIHTDVREIRQTQLRQLNHPGKTNP